MGQSRASQISVTDTPYYHIVSHVVRNNVLCGINPYNNVDYGPRKQWVLDRIKFLSTFFAIDVAGYAIMSTHCHMILYINQSLAKSWSLEEVYDHWTSIYKPKGIVKKWKKKKLKEESKIDAALILIEQWRSKLSDISWFMRDLNQYIARRANKEDGCKGHFWEGRFKSYALLDETALITCMGYIDLNPIRANNANSIEESEFTSIYERLHDSIKENDNIIKKTTEFKPLISFLGDNENSGINKNKISQIELPVINIKLTDYLELLDWTSRVQRDDKFGFIEMNKPSLLKELGFFENDWIELANNFGDEFHCAVGTIEELENYSTHLGKKRICKKRRLGDLFH